MKLFQSLSIGALALLAVVGANAPAQAGDGFPPFGAWVYGTRPAHGHMHPVRGPRWGGGYGLVHHGSVGYGSFGYRSVGYGSFGYGGFGYGGFGYSGIHLRTGFGGLHHPHLYRASYPAFGWYGGGYPWYRTSYYAPSYYVPSYSVAYPGYTCGVSSFYRTYYAPPVYSAAYVPLCSYPAVASPGRFVSQSALGQDVPDELLEAADQIFRAGGYREAAIAYARLSVRFGASDLLWGRRFIAQVADGDLEQAVVIAGSAELAGAELQRESLPDASLSGLGLEPRFVGERKEALAKLAYTSTDDAHSLLALGRWLHLAGDDRLAHVFLERAEQLSGTRHLLERLQGDEPTSSPGTEFVSLESE